MLINSPRFGTIEVDEEAIITFPEGLLGFRDFKRYYFHEPAPGTAFKWMQCIDLPALGFVVTDPRLFKPDYGVKVASSQLEGLEIEKAEDALVWVILTIPEDPAKMTANLQGPLVINAGRRLGVQLVLSEDDMTTKYPVLEGMKAKGRAVKN